MKRPPANLRRCLENFCLAAAYTITAKLGLSLAFSHQSVSPVWPPAGVALAALLIFGPRLWPGVFLGALFSNYLITNVSLPVAAGIALGNTLEAVAGLWLFHRFIGRKVEFERPLEAIRFAILVAGGSAAIAATLGVVVLCTVGAATWSDYFPLWFTWWMGDSSGILVIAPWLVSLRCKAWEIPQPKRLGEAVALVALVTVASEYIFGGVGIWSVPRSPAVVYLVFSFLVWASVRFHQTAVTSVAVLFSAIAIWCTVHGLGPFVESTQNASLLALQSFIVVSTMTGLILTSAIAQMKRSENSLASEVAVRKQAEEKLARLVSDLTNANREMEQFTQVASHDLQEPLRTVSTYMTLVAKHFREKNETADSTSLDYVDQAVRAATRMQKLIQDLLKYTHATRRQEDSQVIECGRLVLEVISDLQLLIDETGAEILVDSLPPIQGDRVQVGRVFQNLIVNAIKFRAFGSPKIRIQSMKADGMAIFSIQDNGIGFAMDEASQIFDAFKRLPKASRFPGSGLGLAVCKKIVERHGGKIWANSKPGEGSTFYFTLRLSEAQVRPRLEVS